MISLLSAGHFFGKRRALHGVDSLRDGIVLREYAAGTEVPAHEHERGHFCYVLDGNYRERIDGGTVTRAACDLLWHPAGAVHSEEHGAPGHHLLWEPAGEGLAQLPEEPLRIPAADACELGPRIVLEAARGEAASQLDIDCVLNELVAVANGIDERSSSTPDWLARVEECVHDRFRTSIGLAELAAEAGVSTVHLARVWRRRHGRTIGEYVRRHRIAWAERRLARASVERRDVSLTEIALEAGFADLAHFSRTFRALTGCAPSAYRALI